MAKVDSFTDPEEPNSTRSISKTALIKGSHTFEIQGFSLTKGMGVGKYISSDTFCVGGHMWQIQFYPDGKKKYESGGDINVSLDIAVVSKKCEEDIRVWLLLVLLDESGNKWQRFNGRFKMEPKDTRCLPGPYAIHDSKRTIGYEYFCKRSELEASQFIKDDYLTIQCNVGVVKTSMYGPKTLVQLSDLRQSYKQLLESREGSDVSFEVEGETFYAHKIILSTMSPVFNAQFFGPLKEENTQCIKIEEMQAPVFKALLHFIYCDVIPDFDSKCGATIMTQHLLAAADRYGIQTLRSLCELRLCKNIDINSLVSSLALAEQHGCFQLKSRCLEFIGRPKNLEGNINSLPYICKVETFVACLA
ncbi:hypothetical protein RD792_017272 [Penstemon davidsonii]|uniref:Uncharacterized protein n=1 Tax=Penstemon davidsonii TaxID=160366 RepID=A0ABR0CMA7_9LAMI|nr:hypothetical protein RD792_017272 [Penstemon davidsonii]